MLICLLCCCKLPVLPHMNHNIQHVEGESKAEPGWNWWRFQVQVVSSLHWVWSRIIPQRLSKVVLPGTSKNHVTLFLYLSEMSARSLLVVSIFPHRTVVWYLLLLVRDCRHIHWCPCWQDRFYYEPECNQADTWGCAALGKVDIHKVVWLAYQNG